MDFINTGSAFLNFLIWFGLFILIIEILTFIHELGHFIVAKLSGVRVAEFAIGFGPVMFQWGKKGTKYSIRWLPFGGYVSVLSQDVIDTINKVNETEMTPQQMEQVLKKIKPFTLDEDFSGQTKIEQVVWWKKVVFALMGVTFNLITMFIFVWIFAGAIGSPTNTGQIFIPVVTEVDTSERQAYTRIVYVDTVQIDANGDNVYETTLEYDVLQEEFYSNVITTIEEQTFTAGTSNSTAAALKFSGTYDINRDGSTPDDYYVEFMYLNTATTGESENSWTYASDLNAPYWSTWGSKTGSFLTTEELTNDYLYEEYTYQTSPGSFGEAFVDTGRAILNSFLLMFTFGAVQIEETPTDHAYYLNTSDMAEGWIWFLGMMIIFSALLIIFNILPIPPLDGWKATQWTYEGLSGKLIKPETEKALTKAGWGVILIWTILLIFLTPLFI